MRANTRIHCYRVSYLYRIMADAALHIGKTRNAIDIALLITESVLTCVTFFHMDHALPEF